MEIYVYIIKRIFVFEMHVTRVTYFTIIIYIGV